MFVVSTVATQYSPCYRVWKGRKTFSKLSTAKEWANKWASAELAPTDRKAVITEDGNQVGRPYMNYAESGL